MTHLPALYLAHHALLSLEEAGLGSSPAACHLQFAVDLLESHDRSRRADAAPDVYELVG